MLNYKATNAFTKLKAKDINQKQICMSSKITDSEQVKQMKIFYKQNQMVFKFKLLVVECLIN